MSIELTDKEMRWLERRIDSHHDEKIEIMEDDHYIMTELLPRLIYEVRWSRGKIENDRVFISGLLDSESAATQGDGMGRITEEDIKQVKESFDIEGGRDAGGWISTAARLLDEVESLKDYFDILQHKARLILSDHDRYREALEKIAARKLDTPDHESIIDDLRRIASEAMEPDNE